ncbi:MAG: diguanylate cyclase [Xanthomonadales bacterium]|nr:diguanylate cyclase [Xanthomonadales bacterium]
MRSLRRAGFAVRALPTLLCVGALAMFVVAPALHARQAAEQTDAAASPAVEPSAADAVESAVALVDADRPAALGRLRAIWEDPDHPLRGRAAVALTGVMVDGPDNEAVETLSQAMLDSAALSADERALVFANRLRAQASLKQWPDDDSGIESRVETFAAAATPGDARASLWQAMGRGRLSRGRFPDAEQSFRKALDAYDTEQMSEDRSDYLRDLGVALAQQGKLDQALEYMLASQSAREALGLPDSHLLLGNLAGLHLYMERWEKALELSERAIAASPPESAGRAKYINNSGSALFGLGRLDDARVRFEEALAMNEHAGSSTLSPLNNLAFVLLKQGNTREALRRFEQIAAIAAQSKDLALLGVAYKNIGEAWIALGDRRRADSYLQRARAVYAESDNRPKALELYPVLIDNLSALGRHEEALRWMREYKSLSDEVNSVASNERIAQLEANVELKRKESELAVQKADLALKQADLDRLHAQEANERLQRNGLIGAVVALGLILLLLVRLLAHRARAHRELLRKNEEIDGHRERLQQLNDVIRRQSEEDALTGLYNRRHLQALLHRRSTDGPDGTPLLAIVADLDHFKRINDKFGHPAGDKVLQHVAEVLRGCQREGDELIRWGGEEFIWLCRGATDVQAPELCARLQQALADHPAEVEGRQVALTASLGFAAASMWPSREPNVDLAIRLADQAAYRAKAAGRNTWSGYRAGAEPPADIDLDRCPAETLEREGWITQSAA